MVQFNFSIRFVKIELSGEWVSERERYDACLNKLKSASVLYSHNFIRMDRSLHYIFNSEINDIKQQSQDEKRERARELQATWCVRCVWKSIILIYFSFFLLFVGRCIRQQWTHSWSGVSRRKWRGMFLAVIVQNAILVVVWIQELWWTNRCSIDIQYNIRSLSSWWLSVCCYWKISSLPALCTHKIISFIT